jgi:hypothetical protein
MWLMNNLTNGLFVMITIYQIDIAILRILYSELTTIILLKEKSFVSENDNTSKEELQILFA